MQRLLAGADGRRRWRELAFLSMMGGVVGVGAQPPPLGLLQPLSDPTLHSGLRQDLTPALPALLALAVVLLVLLPLSRAFSLAFVEGIQRGAPNRRAWRAHLRNGGKHFFWSSALTMPLYAVLFAAEWRVTGHAWDGLLRADDTGVAVILLTAAGKFLLVLLPWVVLTLPVMVTLYELTPAQMVRRGNGPAAACGEVLRAARRSPGALARIMALRLGLQAAGTVLTSVLLIPCVALSGLVGAPLFGVSWLVSGALGGTTTGPGVAALTVGVLIWAAMLYCLLCAVLVPLSILPVSLATHFLETLSAPLPTGEPE
jgi:hypothetical protein